jgi:hypothetical protein
VVGHEVDDQLETELVGFLLERVEVGQIAEARIDVAVVRDVVARVVLRGGIEGGEPDRVHAQRSQ